MARTVRILTIAIFITILLFHVIFYNYITTLAARLHTILIAVIIFIAAL